MLVKVCESNFLLFLELSMFCVHLRLKILEDLCLLLIGELILRFVREIPKYVEHDFIGSGRQNVIEVLEDSTALGIDFHCYFLDIFINFVRYRKIFPVLCF
jgi:hypothetical protein